MQRREQSGKPVDSSDKMHSPPQQFVLISKAYSDGISLQKEGPKITKEFGSECILDGSRTYQTGASFVKKLVAKHFVTTLTVAEELTYYECIAFERRTVMKNFSETTNIFIPKEKINKYVSSVFYEPNVTKKNFIAGIELLPAKKCIVTEISNFVEGDATECLEKRVVNGEINENQQLINGEVF